MRRLLEDLEPRAQRRWQAGIAAARGETLSGVLGRLGEEGTGLLALLYVFKGCRPATRKVLADLSELLADNGDLRSLTKTAASAVSSSQRLEGAAVVVDELLPGRSRGGRQRWVDTEFAGKPELSEVLELYGSTANASVLGKLLQPHASGRMERLIRFYAGELPDLKPERQQLEALVGINNVMRRVDTVRRSWGVLLSARGDTLTIAVGRVIDQAVRAQRSVAAFNGLAQRIEKIEEPWAKALATWVGAVFAERIWSGVEKDEASLKAWERVAESAKLLASATNARLGELREQGLSGLEDFVSTERSRLRASLDDTGQLTARMNEFEGTLAEVGELGAALNTLRDRAGEHKIDVSALLRGYRPEAGRVAQESEITRGVLDLLEPVDEEWPSPTEGDLRAYLALLTGFAKQSRAERMRVRLGQILGLAAVSKEIVLDADDLVQIESARGDLTEGFARACADAVELERASGSDKILVWVREALAKQKLLTDIDRNVWLSDLDARVSRWATDVTVRPAEVEAIVAARQHAKQQLTNLSRSVDTSVMGEMVEYANREPAGQCIVALSNGLDKFLAQMESLGSKLGEVAGSVTRPFPGGSQAEVLNNLEAAVQQAEEKRSTLHREILELGKIAEALADRGRAIPSPLTVQDAERLAASERERVANLLEREWVRVKQRLKRFRLDEMLEWRADAKTPQENLAALGDARDWCGLVESEADELVRLGLPIPEELGADSQSALRNLREAVAQGRGELERVSDRVRMLALRASQLGVVAGTGGERSFIKIPEARSEVDRLETELRSTTKIRLGEASQEAQRVYEGIVSDSDEAGSIVQPVRELKRLGLLRTVEG
jgi:hypothetical protein